MGEEIILQHQMPCECCYVYLDPPIRRVLGGDLDVSVLHMRRALRALGEKTDGFRDKLEKRIRKAVKDGRAQSLLGRLEGGERVRQACIFDKRLRDLEIASKLKSDAKAVRKMKHNWIPVSPGCTQSVNLHENVEEAKEMESTEVAVPTTEGDEERNENVVEQRTSSMSKEEVFAIIAEDNDNNEKLEVEYKLNECKDVVKQVVAGTGGSSPSPVKNHHSSTVKNAIKVKCPSGLQEFGMQMMVSPECPSMPRSNTSAAEISYQPKQELGEVPPKYPEKQSRPVTCTTGGPIKGSRTMNNVMKLVNQLEKRVSNQQKGNEENVVSIRASSTRHSGKRNQTDDEDRESYDMYPVYSNVLTEPTEGADNNSWDNEFSYPNGVGYGSSGMENEFSYQESDILSDDETTKTNSAIEAQYNTQQKGGAEQPSSSQPQEKQREEENVDEKFFIPDWARGIALATALDSQFGNSQSPQDPDLIFQEFSDCDLERIFERGRKRYSKRTSSGNWKHDKLTIAEKVKYKHDMGYTTIGVVGMTAQKS
eukprot:292704_1